MEAQTRAVRRTISQNDGSIMSPGGIKCHVVQMHNRVGTQITSTCNDTADVQCRHFQAKQAFGALAKRCFASHELDLGTKVFFFSLSHRDHPFVWSWDVDPAVLSQSA